MHNLRRELIDMSFVGSLDVYTAVSMYFATPY